MQVENLSIEIESVAKNRFRARVEGQGCEEKVDFSVPFDVLESESVTSKLGERHWRALQRQVSLKEAEESFMRPQDIAKARKALREAHSNLFHSQHKVGRRLMKSLLDGELGQCIERCLRRVNDRGSKKYLRIQLLFDPDDKRVSYLASLPWELLYHDDYGGFLGTSEKIVVARLARRKSEHFPLFVEGPLRILVVQSVPADHPEVQADIESQIIREALKDLGDDQAQVILRRNISLLELHDELVDAEEPIHVVHFIGHGGSDRETGDGTLAFVDRDGDEERVPGARLVEALKVVESLRLVVLSTCLSGVVHPEKAAYPFVGISAAVLRAGVPAVVAMQSYITDEAAFTFSRGFYRELAKMEPVDLAVARGRRSLSIKERLAAEWATPALFLRTGESTAIFTDDSKEGIVLAHRGPILEVDADGRPLPLRVGIHTPPIAGRDRDHSNGIEEWAGRRNLLNLGQFFDDNRRIREKDSWNSKVYPELREFLFAAMDRAGNRPIDLDLSTHLSLAFATGYVMEVKSGFDFRIHQRLMTGKKLFFSQDEPPPPGPWWNEEESEVLDEDAKDVALAVGVTTSVQHDVEEYVDLAGVSVRRIIPVSIAPEPGHQSVLNGSHAMELAQKLTNIIRDRDRAEKRGTLHLFISAPNALLFYLGQQARGFGHVQLYEYSHGDAKLGGYRPSLQFPPPKTRADETPNEPKRPFRTLRKPPEQSDETETGPKRPFRSTSEFKLPTFPKRKKKKKKN